MKNIFLTLIMGLLSFTTIFSQQTVGTFHNDAFSENGYTLFTVRTHIYLIDNCGHVVNQWESEHNPGLSVYLLENGNLLRAARVTGSFSGGGIGGRVEMYNWEGDLLWAYDYASDEHHQHHDIEPLPNGNFLLIAWEEKSFEEAVQAGRDPSLTPNQGVWPDKVVEIEMVGSDEINVVWEWHAWDHMIQDFDPTKDNFGVVADHPELLDANFEAVSNSGPGNSGSDWLHCNAVAYNEELDQIVLSSRHWSEIWVIDHSTTTEEAAGHTGGDSGRGGDILYRYGNPEAYDRGDVTTQMFFGQHDVKWIPEGYPNGGLISVFNNGQGRPGGSYSSIDVIDPPMDTDGNYILLAGEVYGPQNLTWTYEADPASSFYSSNISGAHFLPNGNALICDGNAPRFFEVDADGDIHWDYVNPVMNNGNPVPQESTQQTSDVFRATRYPAAYAAFEGRDLTPGDPIELNPIDYGCQIFDSPVATVDVNLSTLKIYPNPSADIFHLNQEGRKPLDLTIYNLMGEAIDFIQLNDQATIDASSWPNGTYFLKSKEGSARRIVLLR